MHNPFTKEDKENRKWAAIKQPVEAVISTTIQMAGLTLLYKGIDALIKKEIKNLILFPLKNLKKA